MRLKQLKLAGFKSFVDPTKITLPSNLSAIVGPNGCGKSNIIDAVRWVLGESSAKNLRGEGMTDVIFNGSSTRKPISQASVELIFDNNDNKIQGPWQSYSEIAIKRQINRDGQADYFVNGQKCRRRDITDLLSGTGLGPRSYAIIEQGTISRLVESKPQELRVFLEEAAGITKYKERRRETENRIKHCRENLSRLADIKHELDTQVSGLESQAQDAEQYSQLKTQERQLNQDIIVVRWQKFNTELMAAQHQKQQQTSVLAEIEKRLTLREADSQALDGKISTLTNLTNSLLKQCYQHETDVATATAEVNLLTKRHQDLVETQDTLLLAQDTNTARQQQQVHKVAVATTATLEIAPQLSQLEQQLEGLSQSCANTEQQLDHSQQYLSDLVKQQHSLRQQLELSEHSSTKIGQDRIKLASQRELMAEKLTSCAIERQTLAPQQKTQHYQNLRQRHQDTLTTLGAAQRQFEQSDNNLGNSQHTLSELDRNLVKSTNDIATTELLIASRLDYDSNELEHHYGNHQQLWQCISVAPQWQRALDVVLGDFLQAYCVDNINVPLADVSHRLVQINDPLEGQNAHAMIPGVEAESLLSRVLCDYAIAPLLTGILCADSVEQAKILLVQLNPEQSVITPCGHWFGHGFVVINQPAIDQPTKLGLLELEQQLKQQQLVNNQQVAAQVEHQKQVQLLEQLYQNDQFNLATRESEANDLHQQMVDAKQQWLLEQQKWQHVCDQHDDIARQITDLEQVESLEAQQVEQLITQQLELNKQLTQVTQSINTANNRLSTLKQQRQGQQRDFQQEQRHKHDAELQSQKLQMQLTAATLQLEQIDALVTENALQQSQLTATIKASTLPLAAQRQLLEEGGTQLNQTRQEYDQQLQLLKQSQQHQQQILQGNKEDELSQSKSEIGIQRANLTSETLKVKLSGQEQALELSESAMVQLAAKLDNDANAKLWPQRLAAVKQQLANIGPINLTAINQYNEQKQRSDLLKTQIDDLESALETLAAAIKKIDRQSKEIFKQTFDAVNRDFKILFPKVFGGGSAQLTLTDSDLLTSGVSIMAQPPGKKNSTIHLLSGGEKALTALSLVFAIFQLNPAPFCMLDEVDAPLDDANVERYCNLVKEMSEKVQFIFITHNKVSMEMADHLTGITMMEAGVSRVVAVDVAQAVSLVQE